VASALHMRSMARSSRVVVASGLWKDDALLIRSCYNPHTPKIPASLSRRNQINCRLWIMARSGNIDHILIWDNEDKLQRSVCNLHNTGEVHNFKV
jgi:hypothetical protein